MRVPRKAGQVIVRVVVPEIVEQQKRIEVMVVPNQSAAQVHSRAFEHRRRLRDALYWTDRHTTFTADGPMGQGGCYRAFCLCSAGACVLFIMGPPHTAGIL